MQSLRVAAVSLNSELGKRRQTLSCREQYCEQAAAERAELVALKQARIGHRKLLPVATIKAGRIYGSASLPVEG